MTLRLFWTMLAHYHGQVWNASVFGRSFGVADTTVRRYLEILAGTFAVRVLPAWSENISKRQVKSPMIYLSDSGILHTLLGIDDKAALLSHPRLGASWEGFALREVVQRLGARSRECFFWATHGGAELDLLVVRGRRRLGFEVKRTEAPKVTSSMRVALSNLGLTRLYAVHAGQHSWELDKRIKAVALQRLLDDIPAL